MKARSDIRHSLITHVIAAVLVSPMLAGCSGLASPDTGSIPAEASSSISNRLPTITSLDNPCIGRQFKDTRGADWLGVSDCLNGTGLYDGAHNTGGSLNHIDCFGIEISGTRYEARSISRGHTIDFIFVDKDRVFMNPDGTPRFEAVPPERAMRLYGYDRTAKSCRA